jgi:chloramphenicol 3-O phosphotransferase
LFGIAQDSWAYMNQNGAHLLVDHVLINSTMREQARVALTGALWVGVTCETEELIRREAARGDRFLGFASGTAAIVHDEMSYDLVVDTTANSAKQLASEIFSLASDRLAI